MRLKRLGLDVQIIRSNPDMDLESPFPQIYAACSGASQTSKERLFALYSAVKYAIRQNIPGDFVECGVFRGGSCMVIAKTLLHLGVANRKIYLYDTFQGMAKPSAEERYIGTGKSALDIWKKKNRETHTAWSYASLETVRRNMLSTGYPANNIVFVKGKVEDTIPGTLPKKIALLRLDTDWYESTKHEMDHLYPLLSARGVLILDDYGSLTGAKRAVDEYFGDAGPLLIRIDPSGCRVAIKE